MFPRSEALFSKLSSKQKKIYCYYERLRVLRYFLKGIIMNKLLILAAFAVVAGSVNVEAATTRSGAAKDPEHPVTKANAAAKKAGRKGARADEVIDAAKKTADKEIKEEKAKEEAAKSFFQRSKVWAGEHKTEIAVGAGATVVAGFIVDAIVRKDKSLVMRLVNKIKGTKAEKPVLAEVEKQLAAVAAN